MLFRSVPDLATVSDWTGALLFLKSLLILLGVSVCEHDGVEYDKDSILDFHFTDIFLAALSELTKEVKVHLQNRRRSPAVPRKPPALRHRR